MLGMQWKIGGLEMYICEVTTAVTVGCASLESVGSCDCKGDGGKKGQQRSCNLDHSAE